MEQVFSNTGRRISGTQFDSYHSLSVKQLSAKQQMVMDCFDLGALYLTREEIARRTNLKLSSVCGRVRELLDAKRLSVRGSVRDVATGKRQELIGLPVSQ